MFTIEPPPVLTLTRGAGGQSVLAVIEAPVEPGLETGNGRLELSLADLFHTVIRLDHDFGPARVPWDATHHGFLVFGVRMRIK